MDPQCGSSICLQSSARWGLQGHCAYRFRFKLSTVSEQALKGRRVKIVLEHGEQLVGLTLYEGAIPRSARGAEQPCGMEMAGLSKRKFDKGVAEIR